MNQIHGWIYKITNKVNGKVYVGQTTNKSIERYWSNNHQLRLKKNEHWNDHLQSAWNKYGEETFLFEVLEQFDPEMNFDLDMLEMYWIKELDSMNPDKGYNKTEGGGNGKRSDETKLKISKAKQGKPGVKHTEEHKRYMSDLMKGRSFSESHRQKISEANKGRLVGDKNPSKRPEVRKILSERQLGSLNHAYGKPGPNRKRVICLNNNTEYESIKSAADLLGLKRECVRDTCSGRQKHTKGFKFQYVNEVVNG